MALIDRSIGINNDTPIYYLPYSTVRYVCSLLDQDQLWKKFVVHMPSPNFEEGYSSVQVREIEDIEWTCRYTHPGSPAMYMFSVWGTRNARVKHLLQALTEAGLYAAAAFVKNTFEENRKKMNNE